MDFPPRVRLDQRFGDPGVSATDWEAVSRALDEAQLFWITTVRADGRPHVTPLVAVWVDDALHFCTGAEEQKHVNLSTNAHVTLTTGCNRWDDGLDVVVEGDARRTTDERTLQRLAEAWASKWDGRWRFEVANGAFGADGSGSAPLVYTVRPTKVIAFGKSPFSQTTFRF